MKEIPLSKGQVTYVDDEDYDKLIVFSWQTSPTGYARTNKKPHVLMHRIIMGAKRGQILDHIDGNRLNNQRSNLRFCTMQQNSVNRTPHGISRFMGVTPKNSGWQSATTINGKSAHIGVFKTEEQAGYAYNVVATRHYGKFVRLNKVDNLSETSREEVLAVINNKKHLWRMNGKRLGKTSGTKHGDTKNTVNVS